jgi:type II secretory pathway pseudopilin PulG
MFIVAILAGLTVATIPSFTRSADLDQETRRLELLFAMALTEARLDSIEYGFRITKTGYLFLQYDDGSQTWVKASAPFHERIIPEGLSLKLKADDGDFKALGDNLPPVLILSSGETTPFELRIESKDLSDSVTLHTEGYGLIERLIDDQ